MDSQINQIIGIDYGAKLAGTTAAAMLMQGQLHVWQSKRGQDADTWLLNLIKELTPEIVFIDAPLSLPAVYTCGAPATEADYFYRSCDKMLQAMSPMFLGGLTARAIKLKVQLSSSGITVFETYPSQARRLLLPQLEGYKKGAAPPLDFLEVLLHLTGYALVRPLQSWHQFDAVLAWYSGYRYFNGQAVVYGDAAEGQIIV